MARPRAKLDIHDQAELLLERLRGEPAGIARERMLAVKHGLEGQLTLMEIARLVGRSQKTIQYWFDLYREGGLQRLCAGSSGRRGRKPALDAKGRKELRKKLARGSFRTAGQASDWLERQFKVKRSLSTIRRWMGKLGAGLKRTLPPFFYGFPLLLLAWRSILAFICSHTYEQFHIDMIGTIRHF